MADIKHLAKLSELELSKKETKEFGNQLDETIEYVKNLEELGTEKVEPTSHTVDAENVSFEDGKDNPRGLLQKEALENAKSARDGCFSTKRVLGGGDHG